MKVLYVYRSLAHWGGIERVLVEKMNHLVTMYGYEVYMLTADQGQHPVPYQLEDGVHLEDLGIRFHQQYQYHGLKRILMMIRLKRLFQQRMGLRLKSIAPDVIVCTTANYVDLDVLVQLKGNVPLVVESHSIYRQTFIRKSCADYYAHYMYHKSLKKVLTIVTLTDGDAIEWRRHFSNVVVIPDMVHMNGGAISTLANKRVIFVGRFDYQKRPLEMVEIWQHIQPKFPDWHLDFYGEGEQQQELENVVQSLNMNIHVHQPTNRIFDCYRQSSILVSTSLYEPFGLVIPEAMSCGLPVIAYDCPYGPHDLIQDSQNGFLVPMNNQQAFAERLSSLISDFSLRQQMGQAAITASQQYSADMIMPLWHRLFSLIKS